MKRFKITSNGFIKVTSDGKTINTYFYHKGDELHFIKAGYTEVFDN